MRCVQLLLLVLLVGACAARQPSHDRAHWRGTVSVPRAVRGDLAIFWLLPDEARQDPKDPARWSPSSFRAMRNAIKRIRAYPAITLDERTLLDVQVDAPPEALVFAQLDTHGQMFNSLLDGPNGGDWFGVAPPRKTRRFAIALTEVAARAPRGEACSGPRDHLEILEAPGVAGSVGNDTRRRLCLHLPAGYDEDPQRRYPVVYTLAGFSGQDSGGSVGQVFRAADEADAAHAAIFVGVNIATKLGASYLVASPVSGDFERFLVDTVPHYVDGKYRTIASSSARGLVGQSTGGFDVVSLALRHSDRFEVVAESSADALDLGSWMLTPDGHHVTSLPHDLLRIEAAFGPPGQMSSYAGDWSPDPSKPWGLAWPADPATGIVDTAVWARWLSQSPSELIKRAPILAAARAHLAGKILLAAGTHDDFELYAPAKRFSEQLTAAGVANEFASDDGDHGGPFERKRRLVRFVLAHLARR